MPEPTEFSWFLLTASPLNDNGKSHSQRAGVRALQRVRAPVAQHNSRDSAVFHSRRDVEPFYAVASTAVVRFANPYALSLVACKCEICARHVDIRQVYIAAVDDLNNKREKDKTGWYLQQML